MSNNPPTNDGKHSSSAYSQQNPSSGSVYSFSVHQPYTNWPLHASHTTPYAQSWYTAPTHQQYGAPKVYSEQATQVPETDESSLIGAGKEGDSLPKFAKQWDAALGAFMKRVGLHQALAGLREDVLLLNEEWEREQVPGALRDLVKDISECTESKSSTLPKQSLEERKLAHIQSQDKVDTETPSAMIKSISRLLKQSRKRNDASNRAEFLQSVAEKRRRLSELGEYSSSRQENTTSSGQEQSSSGDIDMDVPTTSCARANAKPQDRDTQMKYDIVKNEDGPLRRTMKRAQDGGESHATVLRVQDGSRETEAERHPGLTERLETIEAHLAVRYVPSHPNSLLERLKLLEDYIVRLEKDYPPWAALHFNQPNRGWPPPPREANIIVPPHLLVSNPPTGSSTPNQATASGKRKVGDPATSVIVGQISSSSKPGGGSKGKPGKSSLHRAVMEKLEIRRVMNDLPGGRIMSPVNSAQPG